MTIKTLLPQILLFFCISVANAQIVIDDFEDGNFSANPEWTGDTSEFIINEAYQMQLYADAISSPSYISTTFEEVNLDDKEWRFDIKLDFAPSNANKVTIYLASNTANLLDFNSGSSIQEGYFFEIGESGSNDAISLFYRDGNITSEVGRVLDGDFANSFNIRIRVRREAGGRWLVATAAMGSENYNETELGIHNVYNETNNIGFICYFTSSNRGNFSFDNIYFGDYLSDTIPPRIVDYAIIDDRNIRLNLFEMIDSTSSLNPAHYNLMPDNLAPSDITVTGDSINLSFTQAFESGVEYALSVEDISDESGNLIEPDTINFLYFEIEDAEFHDIVINEFLADPSPSEGLPETEFIELYNRSKKYISLRNWTVTDNTSSEGVLPEYILAPEGHLILCPASAVSQFESFGATVAPSSWQILNVTGDSISIQNKEGQLIDALAYSKDWYQDADKDDGGYSLERINPDLPCDDPLNWAASNSNIGGTPGNLNSIIDLNFSGNAPVIEDYFFPAPNRIILKFDKIMDLNAVQTADYIIEPFVNISEIKLESLGGKEVELVLEQDLANNQTYGLSISSVNDCNGNTASNLSLTFTFDNIPPVIENVIFLADNIILIQFDESLEASSATSLENYVFEPALNILEINLFSDNEVVMSFNEPLFFDTNYNLRVNAVQDIFGNAISEQVLNFLFGGVFTPGFNQLLITEIMANPVADQSLPDVQYIELYNTTDNPISLFDLNYMDARDTVSLGLNYMLPNEYVIVCPKSQIGEMTKYGRVIGLSPWPNLNNAGDELQIISTKNELVHQVFYKDSWYKEEFKKNDGGWSLEMTDIRYPCTTFSNWTASQAELRGTPGASNSVTEDNPDLTGPKLVQAFAPSSMEVELYFNEIINLPDLRVDQFSIDPPVRIQQVEVVSSQTVKLILLDQLQVRVKYAISVDQITDCAGNLNLPSERSVVFGLVEEPEQNDIILNEVLYHPQAGGVDFIELYNRSDKFLNLKNWQAKASTQESVLFANKNMVLAPGGLVALTSNAEALMSHYPNSAKAEFIKETDLPNFINEAGVVQIISENGALEELLLYDDDMHIPFLRETQGVSLERISPEVIISKPNSWISAASSAGFATPGANNSQRAAANISFGEVKASPQSFAHNAPGRNYTVINYELSDVGNLATVNIFDAKGTVIKTLANNETLNTTGFFRWDGDDNMGRKVGVGYYIIYFELFSANGQTRILKERVAVGANF